MVRSLLALMGLLAVLGGVGIWQFGFFSGQIEEVSQRIERETAKARAEAMIRDLERKTEELTLN